MIHASQRHHGRPRRFSPLLAAGSVTMKYYYGNLLKINALSHYSVKCEISKICTCKLLRREICLFIYKTGMLRSLNQWM